MRYEEWCIDYYKRDNPGCTTALMEEDKKEYVKAITERLVRRLNYVTGKFYGDRRFIRVYYPSADFGDLEVTLDKLISVNKEKEQKIAELKKALKKRENEIEKTGQTKINSLPVDQIKAEIEKKKNKIEDIKKKLEDKGVEGLVCGYKRFDNLLEIEMQLFELLLKIDEGNLQNIKDDKWEILDMKLRDRIIMAFRRVHHLENWDLSISDIMHIEFKLKYPVTYRMYKIEDKILKDKKLAEDDVIEKKVRAISNKMNDIMKSKLRDEVEGDDLWIERAVSRVCNTGKWTKKIKEKAPDYRVKWYILVKNIRLRRFEKRKRCEKRIIIAHFL